ncbi:twin-arginine translocation signal domain-containing protein [Pseudomonas sp. Ma2-10]
MHSNTSRRTFVKGLAAGGLQGGFGLWHTPNPRASNMASGFGWCWSTTR